MKRIALLLIIVNCQLSVVNCFATPIDGLTSNNVVFAHIGNRYIMYW